MLQVPWICTKAVVLPKISIVIKKALDDVGDFDQIIYRELFYMSEFSDAQINISQLITNNRIISVWNRVSRRRKNTAGNYGTYNCLTSAIVCVLAGNKDGILYTFCLQNLALMKFIHLSKPLFLEDQYPGSSPKSCGSDHIFLCVALN